MLWLVALLVAALVLVTSLVVFVLRYGRNDFWAVVNRNPELAARFFRESPSWFIDEPPADDDIVGPFPFFDPVAGRKVELYVVYGELETSQAEFLGRASGAEARGRRVST